MDALSENAPLTRSININAKTILNVGGRRFETAPDTLTHESDYFKNLLSGKWSDGKDSGGSYFVDADPALFEHILSYLRRGVLPIFWDKQQGHDHYLYFRLLQEARYFRIERLERWLVEEEYLKAVRINRVPHLVQETAQLGSSTEANIDEEYYPIWKKDKVYICPRGIHVHRGDPRACGRACANAQGDSGPKYEEELVLETLVISKSTTFCRDRCL